MPSEPDARALPGTPPNDSVRTRVRALVAALLLHSVSFTVAYMLPTSGVWGSRFGMLLHSVTLGTLMVVGSLFLARNDPDKRSTFGLRIPKERTNVLVEFLVGIAAVFVMYAAVLLFTFAMMGLLSSASLQNAAKSKEEAVGQFARIPIAVSLLIAACAGVWEELAFRGFLFTRIKALFRVPETKPRARGPLLLSIFTCSFFFALGHGYQGPIGLIQTFVAGFGLAVLTAWRGSIYAAVAAHICVDAIGLVAVHFVKG